MLEPRDIILHKSAYDGEGFFGSYQDQGVPTLADLVEAIKDDRRLTPVEEKKLLAEVKALAGSSSLSTPISSLMYKGVGGILGYLISKYFGMGSVGRALSTVAGFGLGRAVYNKLNAPPDPYNGYKLLS